ncbi:MAG: GGDEF domain-containing protein [Marinagarivorans sp.]|nr:GGDEF domain-containing protein [Marinagarivorans sp.]
MKTYLNLAPRISASLITLLLLGIGFLAPPQKMLLFPTPYSATNIYSDASSRVEWQKAPQDWVAFKCTYSAAEGNKYCGASIKFYRAPQASTQGENPDDFSLIKSIDLTRYNGLLIEVNYRGNSKKLQLSLRNSTKNITNNEQFQAGKYLTTTLHPEEYDRQVLIPFDEFHTADWWINDNNVHRKNTALSVSNVIEISVNLPANAPSGEHFITFRSIYGQGVWLTKEQTYIGILITWLGFFLINGLIWAYQLHQKNKLYTANLNSLTQDSLTDPLTQIFNRRGIDQAIEYKIKAHKTFSIFLIDIDLFKNINDTHGHSCGDYQLQQISTLIKNNIREGDLLARWGGEEFMVVMDTADSQHAHFSAEKLRKMIEEHTFTIAPDNPQPLKITITIGMSIHKPSDVFTSTFQRADKALYIGKNNGRNMTIAF